MKAVHASSAPTCARRAVPAPSAQAATSTAEPPTTMARPQAWSWHGSPKRWWEAPAGANLLASLYASARGYRPLLVDLTASPHAYQRCWARWFKLGPASARPL